MSKAKSKTDSNNLLLYSIIATVGGYFLLSRKAGTQQINIPATDSTAKQGAEEAEEATDQYARDIEDSYEDSSEDQGPPSPTSPLVRNSISRQDKADAVKDRQYQQAGNDSGDQSMIEPDEEDEEDAEEPVSIPKAPAPKKVQSPSRAFSPLKIGEKSVRVQQLQQRLGVKPDGIYGKQTAAALKAKYKIDNISNEAQYNAIVKPLQVPARTVQVYPLKQGSRGDKVKLLQQKLGLKADGIFGRQTEARLYSLFKIKQVANEQQFNAVMSRSIVYKGDPTATVKTVSKPIILLPAQKKTVIKPAARSIYPLRMGSRGEKVIQLQRKLGLKADGIFGKMTAATLQARFGITEITGEVVLNNILTKPAPVKTSLPKPAAKATMVVRRPVAKVGKSIVRKTIKR